jgi:hypothetical protein
MFGGQNAPTGASKMSRSFVTFPDFIAIDRTKVGRLKGPFRTSASFVWNATQAGRRFGFGF